MSASVLKIVVHFAFISLLTHTHTHTHTHTLTHTHTHTHAHTHTHTLTVVAMLHKETFHGQESFWPWEIDGNKQHCS